MSATTAIAAGLSATKTGFDLIKGLREALGRPDVNPGDIQARLVELQSLMLDAQRALADAEEENRRLQRLLDEREALKALDDDMDFRIDGGYYVRKSEREKGLIPYCPICWNKDRVTLPLEPCNPGQFRCSIHQTYYENNEYRTWKESRRRAGPSGGPHSWMR